MNIRYPVLFASVTATLVLLGGCANTWNLVKNDQYAVPSQGYTVQLPQGWVSLTRPDKTITLVSHDGEGLDLISIGRSDNDRAFPTTKKAASPDMLPEQLAQDFIAEAKAQQAFSNMQVLKDEPATIGGRDGFHLVFAFTTSEGVRYQSETYGVCTASGFYSLVYRAPVLHYFDQFQGDFKMTVSSFKLTAMQKSNSA